LQAREGGVQPHRLHAKATGVISDQEGRVKLVQLH